MFLRLAGIEVEATVENELILHLGEGERVSRRRLVSVIAGGRARRATLDGALQSAARCILRETDGKGHNMGGWRVVDRPVRYPLNERGTSYKYLFELAETGAEPLLQ